MSHTQRHKQDPDQKEAKAEHNQGDSCSEGELPWAEAHRVKIISYTSLYVGMVSVNRRLI